LATMAELLPKVLSDVFSRSTGSSTRSDQPQVADSERTSAIPAIRPGHNRILLDGRDGWILPASMTRLLVQHVVEAQNDESPGTEAVTVDDRLRN
jgi:hypothetical protein